MLCNQVSHQQLPALKKLFLFTETMIKVFNAGIIMGTETLTFL